MIRTTTYIICDCCDSRLEFGTSDERLIAHDAERRGWHVERRPARHYCPWCKIAAKHAQAMEATK